MKLNFGTLIYKQVEVYPPLIKLSVGNAQSEIRPHHCLHLRPGKRLLTCSMCGSGRTVTVFRKCSDRFIREKKQQLWPVSIKPRHAYRAQGHRDMQLNSLAFSLTVTRFVRSGGCLPQVHLRRFPSITPAG